MGSFGVGALLYKKHLKNLILLALVLFSQASWSQSNPANCSRILRELVTQTQLGTQAQRPLEAIPELRVGTYNTYNLIHNASETGLKSLDQRLGSAAAILDNRLDIVVLQEVENLKSIQQFNQEHLNGLYEILMTKGNDRRGIEIAFLVKKDLPFNIELVSHAKNQAHYSVTGENINIFSRDLPSLKIWSNTQEKTDDPLMIFYGTHFKSKRSRPDDVESRILRGTQVRKAAEIIDDDIKQHPKSFTMIAGDFNGDVRHEAEFDSLKQILSDAFDLQTNQLSDADRVTHTFHPRDGPTSNSQIDAFFVKNDDPEIISEVFVHRYKDANGNTKPLPQTWREREENPSDHFPVILKINFERLLEKRGLIQLEDTAA